MLCPKRHSLYEFKDCYHKIGLFNKSKTCSFIKFANHRQPWRRRPCGETLLKEVTLKDNTQRLYPHKIYCYQSLIESIKPLVKRPNFVDRCELWRSRELRSVGQILGDIFDGRVWRISDLQGCTFFSCTTQLWVKDWMQPFEHTTYSVGVIYLVFMNLPMHERFKRENVILAGIIPDPSEPPRNINTYLSPLVDELLILWKDGIMVRHSSSQIIPERFRAALLCVACNIPASRKVCCFTGHQSRMGCNKCTKAFVVDGVGIPNDYSGFENCPSRNTAEHRRIIEEVQYCPEIT